ncbi:hypothetical protein [Gynuella sp.]|uniref:hypothetical protein n=1 Tax=Gynuella sp. TaxID=2969146 RepID=UPI003D0E557C
MKNRKLVLVSDTGYDQKHDDLLLSILDKGYELFCSVGVDCELWEAIMDELAVGDGNYPRYITTTSHSGETESDVIEFAKMFRTSVASGVDIVRV